VSNLRDAASLIWPGVPGWPGYPAQQDLAADKRERSMDQLEITVYTRAWCVRAWRVKRLLRRKGYAFEVIDVSGDGEANSRSGETNGSEMAPQVFVDGRLVGGFCEISALNRSGDLDRLVHGEV
jgi:glutaredoxin 3